MESNCVKLNCAGSAHSHTHAQGWRKSKQSDHQWCSTWTRNGTCIGVANITEGRSSKTQVCKCLRFIPSWCGQGCPGGTWVPLGWCDWKQRTHEGTGAEPCWPSAHKLPRRISTKTVCCRRVGIKIQHWKVTGAFACLGPQLYDCVGWHSLCCESRSPQMPRSLYCWGPLAHPSQDPCGAGCAWCACPGNTGTLNCSQAHRLQPASVAGLPSTPNSEVRFTTWHVGSHWDSAADVNWSSPWTAASEYCLWCTLLTWLDPSNCDWLAVPSRQPFLAWLRLAYFLLTWHTWAALGCKLSIVLILLALLVPKVPKGSNRDLFVNTVDTGWYWLIQSIIVDNCHTNCLVILSNCKNQAGTFPCLSWKKPTSEKPRQTFILNGRNGCNIFFVFFVSFMSQFSAVFYKMAKMVWGKINKSLLSLHV